MVIPVPVIAAGISAVGSLLGGRKAAKEQARAIAAQNAYNAPKAIRARAEEGGFNPLLFVGPGVGLQTATAAPVMGQAIANAGLAVADGLTAMGQQQAYASALEEQNAELRKAVERATLRPEVAGIYGVAQPVTVGAAPSTARTTVQLDGSSVPLAYGVEPGAIDEVSTTTRYSTPGAPGVSTEATEGIDIEDLGTGLIVDGINQAKAVGDIPTNFEAPYLEAGRNVGQFLGTAFYKMHLSASKTWGTMARERGRQWRDRLLYHPHPVVPKAGAGKLPMKAPWYAQ